MLHVYSIVSQYCFSVHSPLYTGLCLYSTSAFQLAKTFLSAVTKAALSSTAVPSMSTNCTTSSTATNIVAITTAAAANQINPIVRCYQKLNGRFVT